MPCLVDLSDIDVGFCLPPLRKPPITRATLAYFCGASNDHNPVHVDSDYARAVGKDDVFAHGMLSMAYLGQMLTQWLPQEAIVSFEVKFVAIVRVGDEITCEGEVVEIISTEAGAHYRLKLRARDQFGEIKLSGQAVVREPRS